MSTGSWYGGASARVAPPPIVTAAAASPTEIFPRTPTPPPPDTVAARWQTREGSVKYLSEVAVATWACAYHLVRGVGSSGSSCAAGHAGAGHRAGRVRAQR